MIDNQNMSMADAEKLAETGTLPEKNNKDEISFADLGLSKDTLKAIELKGYKTPSAIQAGVIPLLLNGDKDIIGQAQTGTGKTAAFALPLLERLDAADRKTQAIVLAPTRELAIQVAQEIESFAVPNSPTVTTIYGGNSMFKEISELKRKPTIVVGTPGRIQHHIRNGNLKLDDIKYFVLDEADEMLNFGFRSEIESILDKTPKERKVLLFSATMPKSILDIVKNYMGDYDTVKVASKEMTNENITQKYYCLQTADKLDALCRIMEVEQTFYSIIFCRTKREVDKLAANLKLKHLDVEGIHGDIDQKKRERILMRFKSGHTKLLVATDVAARGIDVAALNFVVNYTIPESYETYTHRIGRTGRAGNKGTAITFVTQAQLDKLRFFERSLRVKMELGVLPGVDDVIAKKQQHLIEKVEHIINNEDLTHVRAMAKKLLEEGDAETLVAALLKTNYADEFNTDSYAKISQASTKGNFKQEESGRRRGNSRTRHSSNTRRGDRKQTARRDSTGNRIKGEGSNRKSRGGKVGGGSARKFGSATKKQFGGSKNKKKFGKPKSPNQYAGGK
ncbi:MAG: DEAD/DEAH box helicase [Candidatus Pacebacteria bacterium]|nr:DEAD/DEAH box helicase [Candidatus Paceibacterota bacterium]